MGRNKDAHADGSLKRHSWIRVILNPNPASKHSRQYNANNVADIKDNVRRIRTAKEERAYVKQLRKDGILK